MPLRMYGTSSEKKTFMLIFSLSWRMPLSHHLIYTFSYSFYFYLNSIFIADDLFIFRPHDVRLDSRFDFVLNVITRRIESCNEQTFFQLKLANFIYIHLENWSDNEWYYVQVERMWWENGCLVLLKIRN